MALSNEIFYIYRKDGSKIQVGGTSANPEYLCVRELQLDDTFLGQKQVTVTIKSPTPIEWKGQEYIILDEDKYSLKYEPSMSKQARKKTYGEAFVYENVILQSVTDETTRVKFQDYVLEDNNIHYSSMPTVYFYGTVKDLAMRIQANLDRVYSGDTKWTIVLGDDLPTTEKQKTYQNVSVWDAITDVWNIYKVLFYTKGRTLYIGSGASTVPHDFQYGIGKGLKSLKKETSEDNEIITRLHVYGSQKNLPYRYYNKLGKHGKYTMPVYWISDTQEQEGATYSPDGTTKYIEINVKLGLVVRNDMFTTSVDVKNTLGTNGLAFSVRISIDGYECNALLGYTDAATDVLEDGNRRGVISISNIGTTAGGTSIPNVDLDEFNALYEYLTTTNPTNVVVLSGADFEKTPTDMTTQYGGILLDSMYLPNLMLPPIRVDGDVTKYYDANFKETTDETAAVYRMVKTGNGTVGLDIYLESIKGIEQFGVLEGNVTFDNDTDTDFEDLVDDENGIYPTLSVATDGSNEIVSATQLTDAGVFDANGNFSPKVFSVVIKSSFNPNLYKISGETMQISFKSGALIGRTFDFNCSDNGDGTYTLTCNREADNDIGLAFPNSSYNVQAGDKFVFLGIELPDEYIQAAEIRLLNAGLAYLANYDHTKYTYTPELDNIFLARLENKETRDALCAGATFWFTDEDVNGTSEDEAITIKLPISKLTMKVGSSMIREYEITLADTPDIDSDFIKRTINSVGNSYSLGGGSSSVDEGALKLIGNRLFLSKVTEDTASALIGFLKGITIGDNGTWYFDKDGNIKAKNIEVVKATLESLVAGVIQSTSITTDYLTVTKKAHFFELVIDKIQSVGGTAMLTAANCKLDIVEAYDESGNAIDTDTDTTTAISYWRCYWRATDNDGESITNDWKAGDQAICYTNNLADGTTYEASDHYWWRLVSQVGASTVQKVIDGTVYDCHWFDISNSTYDSPDTSVAAGDEIALRKLSSDAPLAGDTVTLLGHRPTTDETDSETGEPTAEALERCNAIVLATSKWIDNGRSAYTDSDGNAVKAIEAVQPPALVIYSQITSFSLCDCRAVLLSPSWNGVMSNWHVDTSEMQLYSHTAYCNGLSNYADFITKEQAITDGKLDTVAEYSYVGFLIDHNTAASTTPSDYTWMQNKGQNGRSVAKVETKYYRSTSATDYTKNDDVSYSKDNFPGLTAAYPYLWIGQTFTDDENNTISNVPPYLAGVLSKDGTNVTVSETSTTYAVTDDATQPADSAFTETAVPTDIAEGSYLWSRTYVLFSNGKSNVTYAVSHIGKSGTSVGIAEKWTRYAVTDDATQPADDDFTLTAVPTDIANGKYLWAWTHVKYDDADGTETNAYTVSRTGIDGDGVEKATVDYFQTSDETYVSPDSITGWGEYPTALTDGHWLYTRTTITYTDGEPTVSYAVSRVGTDGASYAGVAEYYAAGASATEQPYDTPAVGKHTDSLSINENWRQERPTLTAENPYLWNFEVSSDSAGNRYVTAAVCIGNFAKGIADIAETYALSAYGSPDKDGADYPSDIDGWTAEPQSVAPTEAKPYQWNKTVTTYNDGTAEAVYHVSAVRGGKGDTGEAVKTVTENYVRSKSNTDYSQNDGASDTPPALTAEYPYLWNKETVQGDKGSTLGSTDWHLVGSLGSDGVGITDVVNHYLATDAASGVTTSTDGWTTAVQSVSEAKPYLWNYEEVFYDDGTSKPTTPCVIGHWGSDGAAADLHTLTAVGASTSDDGTECATAYVKIDGSQVCTCGWRGVNFHVYDTETHALLAFDDGNTYKQFDTYGTSDGTTDDTSDETIAATTQSLIDFMSDYADSRYIIILTSRDACSVLPSLVTALEGYGLDASAVITFQSQRNAIAFIGQWGMNAGTAYWAQCGSGSVATTSAIVAKGVLNECGRRGDKGDTGDPGSDGKDALTLAVSPTALVFDADSSGIVSNAKADDTVAYVTAKFGSTAATVSLAGITAKKNCTAGLSGSNGVRLASIDKVDSGATDESGSAIYISATSGSVTVAGTATLGTRSQSFTLTIPFTVNMAAKFGKTVSDINGLTSKYADVSAANGELETKYSELEQTASGLTSRVGTLESDTSGLKDSYSEIKQKADSLSLKVGQTQKNTFRNLLPNSYVRTVRYAAKAWGVVLAKGTTYTLSACGRTSSATYRLRVRCSYGTSQSSDLIIDSQTLSMGEVSFTASYSGTYTVTAQAIDADGNAVTLSGSNYFHLEYAQLEEGSVATAWSPRATDNYGEMIDTAKQAYDSNGNLVNCFQSDGKLTSMTLADGSTGNAYYLSGGTASAYKEIRCWNMFSFEAGETYTISCYVKGNGTATFYTWNEEQSDTQDINLWDICDQTATPCSNGIIVVREVTLNASTWRKVEITFTCKTDTDSGTVMFARVATSGHYCYIYGMSVRHNGLSELPSALRDKALKDTGIDIEQRKITLTSDNVYVRNNAGETTAMLDADGNLTAGSLNSTPDTDYGASVSIKGGLLTVKGQGEAKIEIGLDSAGYATLSFYGLDGTKLYDLGPDGINLVRSSSRVDKVTLVDITNTLGISSLSDGTICSSTVNSKLFVNPTSYVTVTLYRYHAYRVDGVAQADGTYGFDSSDADAADNKLFTSKDTLSADTIASGDYMEQNPTNLALVQTATNASTYRWRKFFYHVAQGEQTTRRCYCSQEDYRKINGIEEGSD